MTLASALGTLGYNVCHKNAWWKTDPQISDKAEGLVMQAVNDYDAFMNNPWPLFYKELDGKFPGSKFILSIRDEKEWLESARRHFSGINRPEIPWIYGVDQFDGHEDVFLERYRRHNREVKEYFKERPDDLLVIDLTRNSSWRRICDFLNKPVPDISFPHVNKSGTLRQEFQKRAIPLVARVRGVINFALSSLDFNSGQK